MDLEELQPETYQNDLDGNFFLIHEYHLQVCFDSLGVSYTTDQLS